jgi:exopolysaccharide biosynthesis predicted pyruvyltransferase EpsI
MRAIKWFVCLIHHAVSWEYSQFLKEIDMISASLDRLISWPTFHVVIDMVRKTISKHKSVPEERLHAELARLALGAPHILADIGFHPDVEASTPNCMVWRRDDVCVAVHGGAATVRVTRD